MKNHYSASEIVKTACSLLTTKLCFSQARLIRRPVYIRGKKSIIGGVNLTTGRFCRFDLQGESPSLFIGDDCEFGDMTHIVAHLKVEIGNNVLIASKCFISDTNHGKYKGKEQDSPHIAPNKRELQSSPVTIGNNVWIGENAVILAGAMIGNGCIIGANSVITRSIPDNCIVVGNNRIIKKYNETTRNWEIVGE